MKQDTGRLYTLDAMRGVAAILVMVFHMKTYGFTAVKGGAFAVDFFFALSGVVVAQAYTSRLQGGLPFLAFARTRLLRLYPMYLVGLGIGLAKAVAEILLGANGALSFGALGVSVVSGLFMLPSPATDILFPLNGPAWSLFFELVVNFAFAAFLVRWATRSVFLACVGAAIALVTLSILKGDTAFGFTWSTFLGGLSRVALGFCVGVFFQRVGLIRQRSASWTFLAPIAGLALLVIAPGPDLGNLYALPAILVVSPFLLWLGGRWEAPVGARKACETLGLISYPLYIIHGPSLGVASFLAKKLGLPLVVWGPLAAVGLVAVSWGLGRIIDPWMRGLFDRLTRPTRAVPATA
ncbi:MAG: acyltransferase [Caulobacter sp.]